jgi:D-alanine-D-alanine ligase
MEGNIHTSGRVNSFACRCSMYQIMSDNRRARVDVLISVDYRPPDYFGPSFNSAYEIRSALRQVDYPAYFFPVSRDIHHFLAAKGEVVVFPVEENYTAGSSPENPTELRRFLELSNIPFVGNSHAVVREASNKAVARRTLRDRGFVVPGGVVVDRTGASRESLEMFLEEKDFPVVVKPILGLGGSIDVAYICRRQELDDFMASWKQRHPTPLLVEEHVEGIEITAWVMGVEPHVECYNTFEIDKKGLPIFDRRTKVHGEFAKVFVPQHPGCPAFYSPPRLSAEVLHRVETTAIAVHRLFNAYSYSRVDMIVRDSIPVILELNTTPRLHQLSGIAISAGKTESFGEIMALLVEHARCRPSNPSKPRKDEYKAIR